MSAEAQVAQLESLLERIDGNRTDEPVRYPDAASRIEAKSDAIDYDDESLQTERPPPPEPRRRPSPATPMEKAISGELALDDEDDEPEVSVSYPDDDEPELVIEEPDELGEVALEAPTAPVGTASPASAPQSLDLGEAQPSAPVAKVVSRDAPRTFGELLDRALGLRPR